MKGLTFMHWSNYEVPVVKRLKAGAVLVGLAWALSATLGACAVMFAWVVLAAGPVYNFSTFVAAGSVFGAILGGAVSGKAAGTLGLLHGFLVGLFYGLFLLALVASGDIEVFSVTEMAIRVLLLGIAGLVGGIFGVNSPGKGRFGSGRKVSSQRIF